MPSSRSPHAHGRSEIWKRPGAPAAIRAAWHSVGERLRALRKQRGHTLEVAGPLVGLHPNTVSSIERGAEENPTLATLAALALAYRVPLSALFDERLLVLPFRKVAASQARPYENCVPLYSLKAAAGHFSAAQEIEREGSPEAWVFPAGKTPVGKGLFVAQVSGESMNRRIPSGAYCLFRVLVRRPRSGQVVLVQHRQVRDPDHGGRYTVKVFRRETFRVSGEIRSRISLEPDSTSPGYEAIVLPDSEDVRAIAELVEVLPSLSSTT